MHTAVFIRSSTKRAESRVPGENIGIVKTQFKSETLLKSKIDSYISKK